MVTTPGGVVYFEPYLTLLLPGQLKIKCRVTTTPVMLNNYKTSHLSCNYLIATKIRLWRPVDNPLNSMARGNLLVYAFSSEPNLAINVLNKFKIALDILASMIS